MDRVEFLGSSNRVRASIIRARHYIKTFYTLNFGVQKLHYNFLVSKMVSKLIDLKYLQTEAYLRPYGTSLMELFFGNS